ncbi:sigma-70 family RNA polymerase sigma factor [Chloroflexota bacterium]
MSDTVQNEAALVKRAQKRDAQAFSEIYEAYFDKIYRYIVLKTGDMTEAEDMTQQVFLKALQSISSYKWTGKPFSAWLYRIAHNLIVDHYRKKSKGDTIPIEDAPELIDPGNDPQEMAENALDAEQLARAIKHLTESQRECVSLRFSGGLSITEVAKALGKTEGAIKALQHSAVLALRRIMVVTVNEQA